MKNKFELEQCIMNCWNVVDDIKTVVHGLDSMSNDDVANALIGLHTIYQLKFEQLFSEFESCITANHKPTKSMKYEPGQLVTGKVKKIKDYGVTLKLDNDSEVKVLLHITDIAWRRPRTLDNGFIVGDTLTAMVLNYDSEHNRMTVGLKQLRPDPYEKFVEQHQVGDIVTGIISHIADYGIFVEFVDDITGNGVEGLVHVSDIDWVNKNIDPHEHTVGEYISVMILEIDRDRRRLSLGIKQTSQNPWEEFAKQHKVGDIVDVIVLSITDVGVFVVPVSEPKIHILIKDSVSEYHRGGKYQCVITQIDADRERVLASDVSTIINPNYIMPDESILFTPIVNWRWVS